MTTTFLARHLRTVIAVAAAIPASALAQPASPARVAQDPSTELAAPDRDVLAVAEQLAADSAQAMERWITAQGVTEDRLFARFYYPIAKTDPQKYSTDYDKLAERDLIALEDKALDHSPAYQYAIVTDLNAYVPAHNKRYTQALSGDVSRDYANNRSKRLLGDGPALTAARNEARYLLQRTRAETGDVIYDLSVPIVVRGKHWGCARIGYRRPE